MLQFLLYMVIGASVALLGVNMYHIMANCPRDNPDAIEAHYDALSYRLSDSELHVQWQIKALNKIVRHLQSQLAVLDRSELDALLLQAEEEAVILALRLAEFPAPAMSWEVEQLMSKDESSSYKVGDYEYISKYGNFTDDISGSSAWDDDWLLDMKKYNQSKKSGGSNDMFGGGKKRFDDDFTGKRSGSMGGKSKDTADNEWDDEYDDPAESMNKEAVEGGHSSSVFRDNLSDSDARHLCQNWQTEHNVKLGTDWGTLPYDLQQKWNQYACDYLLKS